MLCSSLKYWRTKLILEINFDIQPAFLSLFMLTLSSLGRLCSRDLLYFLGILWSIDDIRDIWYSKKLIWFEQWHICHSTKRTREVWNLVAFSCILFKFSRIASTLKRSFSIDSFHAFHAFHYAIELHTCLVDASQRPRAFHFQPSSWQHQFRLCRRMWLHCASFPHRTQGNETNTSNYL